MCQVTVKEILETIKAHKAVLQKKYKVKEIGVFGSYAKGEQKRGSDVDILVDFYETPNLFELIRLENYLRRILKQKVDLVRKPAIRKELKERILGEVIYT
ncbi:MAG: nucleotidyltransferase family protein [Actinomycetota bacterium]|nr:nucleotidyltransferase family protein [Actinomycetota bacterium]